MLQGSVKMKERNCIPGKKVSERFFSAELNSYDQIRLKSLNGDKTSIDGSLSRARINEFLCKHCGTCAEECISQSSKGNRVDPENQDCIKCFHCYAICPQGAIEIQDYTSQEFNLNQLEIIDTKSLSNFLSFRRSIRHFTKEKIPINDLESLINSARFVPSGGNRHSFQFTVITGHKTKKKLLSEFKKIYSVRRKIFNNKLLCRLVSPFLDSYTREFLLDSHYSGVLRKIVERFLKGDDPVFYGAPVVIVIHSSTRIPTTFEDSVLAGYNIALVAQTMGLGTCFVNLAKSAFNWSKVCKNLIGLRQEDIIFEVLLLGYPVSNFKRSVPKKEKQMRLISD
jgi:nitroreductase/Pyruvate/2-oxoacid:ferredoxin oxidoreductase delta subunit